MIHRVVKKILSAYTLARHGHMTADIRYFYRDTYYCKLLQGKYFLNDFLVKRRYKHVSFDGEFGAELMFALPFAYWHHKNGTLASTTSSKFTRRLYYFSENHRETFSERTTEGNYNFELPRVLFSHDYEMSKWEPVPLKDFYKNSTFIFEKPILIIANRYNMEWDGPPISFFSLEMLDYIITSQKGRYTIIYNRPRPQNITNDNSEVYDLHEFDWLQKKHPDVILMEDLYEKHRSIVDDFNHLQLMVYANADRFISTHGGTATFASYFGGTNVILSKKGLEHHFKCFEKLFPKLSNAKIVHAKNEEELKDSIDKLF